MSRLELYTDFSKYLLNPDLHLNNHQVKVFIDDTVLECNGALLANQSPVLHELFLGGDELYLDEFSGLLNSGVMECLTLLYGGEATITIDNIQTILKFSALYVIPKMFEVCLAWILEHMSLANFPRLYHTAIFIDAYRSDTTHTLMEICSGFFLHHSVPNMHLMDMLGCEDLSPLMRYLLNAHVLHQSLPIVTHWIISSERVEMVIDKVEAVFPSMINHKASAMELIEKMNDYSTNVETCKRVIKMHKEICDYEFVNANECIRPGGSASLPDIRDVLGSIIPSFHINPTASLTSRSEDADKRKKYLKGKRWRYCTKDSIKAIPTRFISGNLYVEILLDWMLFSKPEWETVDELWGTISKVHLSKGYLADIKDHIQQTLGFRMSLPINMAYKMGRCYFSIRKDQKKLLLDDQAVMLLATDCETSSCSQDKRRVLELRLCEGYPCYVTDDKPRLPGAVCHWYVGVRHEKTWSVVSLVTNSRGEVQRTLQDVDYKDIFLNCLILK